MGGFGSTRWAWISTKDTVESSRRLDINRGISAAGLFGQLLEWKQDGERVAWVQFRREGDRLVLSYRVRHHGGESQDVEQPTPIVWMPCRFGGARPYFVCPDVVNGIACGRQVAKLYGAGTYFLCPPLLFGSAMLHSGKIAMTGHCGEPIKFVYGLAESRALRRYSRTGQRVCTARLISAFNPLY